MQLPMYIRKLIYKRRDNARRFLQADKELSEWLKHGRLLRAVSGSGRQRRDSSIRGEVRGHGVPVYERRGRRARAAADRGDQGGRRTRRQRQKRNRLTEERRN